MRRQAEVVIRTEYRHRAAANHGSAALPFFQDEIQIIPLVKLSVTTAVYYLIFALRTIYFSANGQPISTWYFESIITRLN
jgi:hypothetical protein